MEEKVTKCSVSKKCGSCQYQGVPYKEQLAAKQKRMKKLLGKFANVKPIIGMDDPFYYRNKVHAVFDRDKKGNIICGTYEAKTHKVVPIEECMIEDKISQEIIRTIRDMLKSFRIKTYDEDTGYGLLRHVLVRRGFSTDEIMVVLVIGSPIFPSKNNFVKALRKLHPEITTVILNVNDKKTSMVLGERNITLYGKGFIKHCLFLAPIIGLLLLEPHLSASMVIIGIVCIMMIVAGCKFKHFLFTGLGLGTPLLGAAIALSPYRLERFVTFLDPWKYAKDEGWQVIQSLYAIGSGGLFGVGLGDSKQKYLYIPEPHNDFIFSILAEELGFFGCAVVLILFAIFIWRGILIAMKAPDMFGSLLATGITALVTIQVIINVAVVTSSMPATGMPLPFFSYRWNSLIYITV